MKAMSATGMVSEIAKRIGVEEASVFPQYRAACTSLGVGARPRGMGAMTATMDDLAMALAGLLHISAGRSGPRSEVKGRNRAELEALFVKVREALDRGEPVPSFGVAGGLQKEHRFSADFQRWLRRELVPAIRDNEGKPVRWISNEGRNRNRIFELRDMGLNQPEIARCVGVSPQRVSQVLATRREVA